MNKITLHKLEYNLLLLHLDNSILKNCTYKEEKEKYIFSFSKETGEVILDELSTILSVEGMDNNFEPNGLGQMV